MSANPIDLTNIRADRGRAPEGVPHLRRRIVVLRKRPLLVAMLALSAPFWIAAQVRSRTPVSLDDRLAVIEDRIAAVEDRLSRAEAERSRTDSKDRLALESEAKLDRLEVRVIQLESAPAGCDCDGAGSQEIIARIRSLERQVSRLRSRAMR